MKNIFDLFRDKKSNVDASEAQAKLQWQSRAAAVTDILRQSVPVFEEYEKELQQRGVSAKLIRVGANGLRLKIPMKWTIGVVAFERDCFVAYIESDPGKSNGYARDDHTRAAGPPSAEAWTGTDELRGFLDRALAIFHERYDRATQSSGNVGP
jgi:hypothetical protein